MWGRTQFSLRDWPPGVYHAQVDFLFVCLAVFFSFSSFFWGGGEVSQGGGKDLGRRGSEGAGGFVM